MRLNVNLCLLLCAAWAGGAENFDDPRRQGQLLKKGYAVIEDGKILRISGAGEKATFDLSGLTVMPGWIDTHVHFALHFDANNRMESGGAGSKEAPELSALYAEAGAYATLMAGFTTIQSVGAKVDGPVRDLINAGELPGPRIITSLRAIYANTGTPGRLVCYVYILSFAVRRHEA